MPLIKQFNQLDPINNGTTAQDNFKLSDAIPAQHTDLASGVNKLVHRTFAQSLCEPVAVCDSNNPQNGAYVATCVNYPDFALSYQDAQQNTQYLIGLKIRVIFTYGITYGSVSDGTYPTLNINGSGAIPMLAQGKTMATGSASAGQTLEFTVIPYGNGIAFDADSNVRESTSDYTIYTDGNKRVGVESKTNLTLQAGQWTGVLRTSIEAGTYLIFVFCSSSDNQMNLQTKENNVLNIENVFSNANGRYGIKMISTEGQYFQFAIKQNNTQNVDIWVNYYKLR